MPGDPVLALQQKYDEARAKAALNRRQHNIVQARRWEAQAAEYERELLRLMGKAAFDNWRNRLLNPGRAPWKNDPRPRDAPRHAPHVTPHAPPAHHQQPQRHPRGMHPMPGRVIMAELDGPEERLDEATKASLRRSAGPAGGRLYMRRVEWLRKRIRKLNDDLRHARIRALRAFLERRLARRRAELRVLIEMGPQGVIGLFKAQRVGVQAGHEWAREHRGRASAARVRMAPGGPQAQFAPLPPRGYRPDPPPLLPVEPGRTVADTPIPGLAPEGDLPALPELRLQDDFLDTSAFTPQRGDQTPFLSDRDAPGDGGDKDADAPGDGSTSAGAEGSEGSELAASPEGSTHWGWIAAGVGVVVAGLAAIFAHNKGKGGKGKGKGSSSSSAGRNDDYLFENRGRGRGRNKRSHGRGRGHGARRSRRAA